MKSLITLALLACVAYANASSSKTFVLVHGAWHGAWCWNKVVPLLEAKGHRVIAIDLPGHGNDNTDPANVTLPDYVNRIVAVSNGVDGTVILVGHSMGGIPIAQAAETLGNDKVEALVFLDAFMPQDNESVASLVQKAGPHQSNIVHPTLMESLTFSDDGRVSQINPVNAAALFYHDCTPSDIAYAQAHVGPQPMVCLNTPVKLTSARYGAITKYYILCTQAHDMDKRSISTNVPCEKIFTLDSSHSPFFSMPKALAAILDGL